MLRVHTVTKGLQNAVAREVAELRPFSFPCPIRANYFMVASLRMRSLPYL